LSTNNSSEKKDNGVDFVLTVFLTVMMIILAVTAIFRSQDNTFIDWIQIILGIAAIGLSIYTLDRQTKSEKRITAQQSFDMRMEILERVQGDLLVENFHNDKIKGIEVVNFLRWSLGLRRDKIDDQEYDNAKLSTYVFYYKEFTRFKDIFNEMVGWLQTQDKTFSLYFLTVYAGVVEDAEEVVSKFELLTVNDARAQPELRDDLSAIVKAFNGLAEHVG
jgi:hypothetical protein